MGLIKGVTEHVLVWHSGRTRKKTPAGLTASILPTQPLAEVDKSESTQPLAEVDKSFSESCLATPSGQTAQIPRNFSMMPAF